MTLGEPLSEALPMPYAESAKDGLGDFGAIYEPLHVVPSVYDVVTAAWDATEKRPNQKRTFADDAIGSYLARLGDEPLLKAEHEIALAKIIENGNDARQVLEAYGFDYETGSDQFRHLLDQASLAKRQFILSNLRLVVSIARRFPTTTSMSMSDIIQEGNLGLEHAVDKYDWREGFRFSTYATFWIRQSIGRGMDQKTSSVRLPGERAGRLRAELRAVGGEADDLSSESSRLYNLTTPVSLNRPVSDENHAELGDLLPSDDTATEAQVLSLLDKELVDDLLEKLAERDPRAALVTRARFGIDNGIAQSHAAIGRAMNINPATVRHVVKRALEALSEMAEVQ